MQRVFITCLLLLTACSSTMDTEQNGLSFALPLSPHAPQANDVLFAKLQKRDGSWHLMSIASTRMPVDLFNSEERVYIQADKQRVMPDYEHHQYYDDETRLFDCGKEVLYKKHTTYNPCASLFSRNTKFSENWFSWKKQLDTEEISKAVKQTDLLIRARQEMALVIQERQRCLALRQQVEKIIAQQKVSLRVIDQTELYQRGHELVSYDLSVDSEIPTEGCEQDLANVKLRYNLGLHQNFNLVLELRGKSDRDKLENNILSLKRLVAEADNKIIPTLYITGKKVQHYNLYKTWSNTDLTIDWRTLDISDTDLRQLFDVHNLGQSTIEIQRITFYINNHAITQRDIFKLLPLSGKKGLEHASRYFMLEEDVRKSIDDIKTVDKKSEQAEFGIKVTYTINGENKTLFKKDMVLLSSIL